MPKNKKQDVIFTLLMSAVMVYGMICYNVALNIGGCRNEVFAAAFHEFPIMWPVAVLLELIFVGRLAQKLAFRLVDPRTAPPTTIMLAISAMSVWLMCPCMSFFACLFFKGGLLQSEFIAIWVQTTVLNFPIALLLQFFVAGPLVRLIFRRIFPD